MSGGGGRVATFHVQLMSRPRATAGTSTGDNPKSSWLLIVGGRCVENTLFCSTQD